MRYRTNEGELIPIITIIIINLLVYLLLEITSRINSELFNQIALNLALSRLTFFREPWTIITFMFTHIEFWHIFANMLTFYFYGSFLNRIVGQRYLLLTYFLGGIVSGIFVLLLSSSNSMTIGASGAVFALGGALAILAPRVSVFIFPIPVPMPLWVAVLIGFLVLIPISFVSWQGHLGGLLFGLASGLYLRRKMRPII